MAQRFRTKIVEIEATRWTGDNFTEMHEWTEGNFREYQVIAVGERLKNAIGNEPSPTAQVYDKLHTTWINVLTGQWIVRGAKGEYYPCDDETFHWKYEEIKPLATQKVVAYKDCKYTPDHSVVCRQDGDTCPECGWTL